ncbi:MAG TPA: DUF47 family protein [Syntrophales bacterium]|nr:DUF47 family protein [Syntrophales bacterium]
MKIFPREAKFFDKFEHLAKKIAEGSNLLAEILSQNADLERKCHRMKEVEHESDEIANSIYRDLHSTFITPFDREDIFSLTTNLDDIMDMVESAATNFCLYRPKRPLKELNELAQILCQSTNLIESAFKCFSHHAENAATILALCIEINSLENKADGVLHRALENLFEQEKEVVELIKVKEILEEIEKATDICEDVSNVIEGIILKYG